MEDPQQGVPPEGTVTRKHIDLPAAEMRKTEKLIEYAFLNGQIDKPTWQAFILFAINCAYTFLKDYEIRVRRGLK